MTIRIKFDITYANGVVEHRSGAVELPKWTAEEAKKQLKWRNPTARSIKILEHG